MGKKAKLLGEAKDTSCILCFLLKSQNPKVKYFLVDEGSFYRSKDSFVCEHCLKWVREVREKCEAQCMDPEKDKFEDLTFWHDPKREETSAIEIKESVAL